MDIWIYCDDVVVSSPDLQGLIEVVLEILILIDALLKSDGLVLFQYFK